MTTHITSNVPPERVDFLVGIAQASGGQLVQKIAEDDGEFTLVFDFPDAVPANPGAGATATSAAAGHAAMATPWLDIARSELGVVESAGGLNNARIVEFHATTRDGPDHDSVPWCSSFVNWSIVRAGLDGTGSKAARSWLGWGVAARDAVPGCIVVLERGSPPKGHVGFLVDVEPGHVRLLGGNQGDRVSVASFPADRVIGMRLPSPETLRRAGLDDSTSAPAQRRRRIDTLARTLWGEARGEPDGGLEAVAAVVVNRARRGPAARFGDGIDGVCRQPRQFSCWNDDDPNRPKLLAVTTADPAFEHCLRVAERAVDGMLADPTAGSDHYHAEGVAPDWAAGHAPARRIGRHLFFNDIA